MIKQGLTILLLAGAAVMVGCEHDPVSTAKTSNVNVPVALLFNHDGCNIYRFEDNGEDHYYAVCGNLPVSTTSDIMHSNGKTTYTVPDEIATVQK